MWWCRWSPFVWARTLARMTEQEILDDSELRARLDRALARPGSTRRKRERPHG